MAQNLLAASVSNINDSGAGSLRQVITDVLAGTASGPVTFAGGVTGTINLASPLPTLTNSITINGPGASVVSLRRSGAAEYRIFTVASNSTAAISGLTIANGNIATSGDGGGGILNFGTLSVSSCVISNNYGYNGGGIANDRALSVSNCVFAGNSAFYGGGIGWSFRFQNGLMTVLNCTFSGNAATNEGGAIEHDATPASLTNTIANCSFSGNAAENYGGAVSHYSGTLIITNCTFTANSAFPDQVGRGGGVAQLGPGALVVINSIFARNYSGAWGGAIHHEGGDLFVTSSTFSNNIAVNSGGAIENDFGTPPVTLRISSSTFAGNSVTNPSFGDGGALWIGVPSTISNSTFSGNLTTRHGGAIFVSEFTTDVANVTMTLNTCDTANAGVGNGGAVFVSSEFFAVGFLRPQNCIIAGNIDNGGQTPDLTNAPGKLISLGYNLLGKTNGSSWVAATGDKLGSIASPLNPLLGTLANYGGPTPTHALLAGSPALDAGNSPYITDQRGQPRPVDDPCLANAPGGNGSDIGAFEAQEICTDFRITAITREGNSVRITWMTPGGKTNALERTAGVAGNFATNGFGAIFTVTNTVGTATNYLDVGAATNVPAFYYRVRLVP